MFKLVKTATVSSMMAAVALAGGIREMVTGDKPEEVLVDYDFSVVSFFRSTEKDSVEIDSYLDNAKVLFEKQIADGTWSARGNIGWFRVDLDEHPTLAINEN